MAYFAKPYLDKDVHRTDRSVSLFAHENMPNPGSSMYASTNHHLEVLKDILCTYNIYNKDLGMYTKYVNWSRP